MNHLIKVAVSPFYNGRGWTDEFTGIDFEKSSQMIAYTIEKKFNLEGIQKQVMLNNLIVLEGDFEPYEEETSEVKENKKEKPEEPKDKKETKKETKKEVEETKKETKKETKEDKKKETTSKKSTDKKSNKDK